MASTTESTVTPTVEPTTKSTKEPITESSIFECFWRVYLDILIAEKYYFLYAQESSYLLFLINLVCLASSLAAVSSFVNENATRSPIPLAGIILFSQIISAIQVLFPYTERFHAARNLNIELSALSLRGKLITDRYRFGKIDDDKLFVEMEKIQQEFQAVENRYAPSDIFPAKKRLHKIAEKDVEQYTKVHFNLEENPPPAQETTKCRLLRRIKFTRKNT